MVRVVEYCTFNEPDVEVFQLFPETSDAFTYSHNFDV